VRRGSADDDGVRQSVEIGVARHQRCAKASGRGVDERVGHGQTMRQGQIGCLEGEGFVHRRDRRTAQRGDRFDGAFFAEVS
jgi:hypothetical protein